MDTSHTAPPPTVGGTALGASLRRTTDDRLLLGLCGGIARSVGASPLAIRLATLVFSFVLLPFVAAAYLGTALIVPRDDGTALLGKGERDGRDIVVMLLSLAIAAPLILGTAGAGIFGGLHAWPAVLFGSVVLLALAIWRPRALFGDHARGRTAPSPKTWAPAPADPVTQATAVAGFGDPFHGTVTGPYPDAPGRDADTVVGGAARAGEAPVADPDLTKDGSGDEPPIGGPRPAQPPAPDAPRRRSIALPILSVLALVPALFVVTVVLGLVDNAWDVWAVMLALMAVGAAGGAVAIAFVRPSYLGAGFLVILAAFLGAGAVGLNQFGPVLDDGVGERNFVPATTAELQPRYTLGVGELTVDLRDLRLRPGSTTTVHTKLGFGQMRVIVPKGVRVTAASGSDVPGVVSTATRNGATAKASSSAPVVVLDAQVRGGQVDLLTGNSQFYENLTVLATASHGFWGTDENSSVRPVSAP